MLLMKMLKTLSVLVSLVLMCSVSSLTKRQSFFRPRPGRELEQPPRLGRRESPPRIGRENDKTDYKSLLSELKRGLEEISSETEARSWTPPRLGKDWFLRRLGKSSGKRSSYQNAFLHRAIRNEINRDDEKANYGSLLSEIKRGLEEISAEKDARSWTPPRLGKDWFLRRLGKSPGKRSVYQAAFLHKAIRKEIHDILLPSLEKRQLAFLHSTKRAKETAVCDPDDDEECAELLELLENLLESIKKENSKENENEHELANM